MESFIRLIGPEQAVELFGIRLVGFSAENGRKVLLTGLLLLFVWFLSRALRALARAAARRRARERLRFWLTQGAGLISALIVLLGLASIWFDNPGRLATALGLITAGLAFALQKVVTAVAGYFVILRGRTFNVGDRIVMGGVRGDVIAISITQTTIMEMGQPPPVQNAEPAIWVRSRQYTGRVVTVSNARIFDEPVYNYTRELTFLWEEIPIPIPYEADRARAEAILLAAAERYTAEAREASERALHELEQRSYIHRSPTRPRVYFRLTDNWLELTVRFIVPEHGIREIKDAISRDILAGFDAAGITIASTTVQVVGVPPLRIRPFPPNATGGGEAG